MEDKSVLFPTRSNVHFYIRTGGKVRFERGTVNMLTGEQENGRRRGREVGPNLGHTNLHKDCHILKNCAVRM